MDGWKNIGGKSYPRVTHILHDTGDKRGLERWCARNPDFKLEVAAVEGTLFHYRILNQLSPVQLELRDEIPMNIWPADILEILDAREAQFMKLQLKIGWPRMIEHAITAGGSLPYCGTLDLEAPIDGPVRIADLKRSKRPQKDHELQIAAYYHARKMMGGKATEGMVIYARPDDVEVVEIENPAMEENVFKFMERAKRFYKKHYKEGGYVGN